MMRIRMKQHRRRKSEAGFTLIEIMVVVFIIGLLGTMVAFTVLPRQNDAMITKARADIKTLEGAVEMYRMQILSYPSIDQGLQSLVSAPADLARPERYQSGGFIKELPADPWGNPYQYVYPGEKGAFDIYSLGADGRIGGDGIDSDIGNWQ
ncbi:MAG: type II secretion system major pseudopilin GspG [Pseudomonadota bacterium]